MSADHYLPLLSFLGLKVPYSERYYRQSGKLLVLFFSHAGAWMYVVVR